MTEFASLLLLPIAFTPAKLPPHQAAMAVADKARAEMLASGGAGLRLVIAMDREHLPVNIIEPRKGLCELGTWEIAPGQSEPSVNCSAALAGATVPEAVLAIAERGAELVWKDFPVSTEHEFIVLSLMTRSWLEAGGKRSDLKTMKDRVLAARVEAWFTKKMHDHARGSAASLAALEQAAMKRLASATCELDERAAMAEQETLLKAKETAKSFANEEDEWAKRNWRLLGNTPR